MMAEPVKMMNLLYYLLTAMISFNLGVVATVGIHEYANFRERKTETQRKTVLRELATELNQQVPVIVNEDLRLDSADLLSGLALVYHYTVLADFSPAQRRQLLQQLRPVVTEGAQSNQNIRSLRADGIDIIYAYRDTTGTWIGRIFLEDDYSM